MFPFSRPRPVDSMVFVDLFCTSVSQQSGSPDVGPPPMLAQLGTRSGVESAVLEVIDARELEA